MQRYNATVISTTGAPGSGKTYSRCARFLWDWWLPEEKGVHWSNFPVNFERFEAKYSDVHERVKIIPKEELDQWALCDGVHGPWQFFEHEDIEGAHIAIDECHNFLPRKGKNSQTNALRWAKWLGEIRHRGATVEFLTQDPQKVNKTVEEHAAVRIQLVSSDDRRDPVFKVVLGDWYELKACFTGSYESVTWQVEERRITGKWVQTNFEKFTLEPQYFVLYDSFNAPHSGGQKAEGQTRVFEKRGRLGCAFWFLKRNWFRLGTRLAIASLAVWFCLAGGIPYCIGRFNEWVLTRTQKPPALVAPLVRPGSKGADKGARSGAAAAPDAVPLVVPVTFSSNGNAEGVSGGVVRSETFRHKPFEVPASGEAQEEVVPRVTLVSRDFISMDDGLMLWVGDTSGGYLLKSIDFSRRCAVFAGVSDGSRLVVPVGGPLGVRRVQADGGLGGLLGGVQPKGSGRTPDGKLIPRGDRGRAAGAAGRQ